jgi:membrane protease YdiL (CAAX protease family)
LCRHATTEIKRGMKCGHWMFFILNFVFTWTFWIAALFFGGWTETLGFIFYVIGGVGPLASALIVVGYSDGSSGIKNLFSRVVDFRSIQAKWLLLSFLIIFAPVFIASILEIAILGTWTAITNALAFFSQASIVAISIIFNLIAVIFEEPGWRGVALESLQKKHTALSSSITVGIFWALWHLPLFVMPGTYQEAIGLGSIGFWLYMGVIPATSTLITWFYNNSRESVLAAIIYHLLNNLAGEIFSLDIQLEIMRVVGSHLIVVLLLYVFGYERLVRNNASRNV